MVFRIRTHSLRFLTANTAVLVGIIQIHTNFGWLKWLHTKKKIYLGRNQIGIRIHNWFLIIRLFLSYTVKKEIEKDFEEVDGVVVHSLGFSAEGSGFESRPGPSESMKLFSTNKLIPSTQISTNVDSHELHL